ncbi:MAG: ARMT1-like domain-containing protein [Eubacteriales bacterium]|nr:ARMT1-like domain-containing protein [Eubacteriales bacterium]
MRMTAECIYCTFRQIDRYYMSFENDPDKRMAFAKRVCSMLAEADIETTAPEMSARLIHMIVSEVGKKDLYHDEKHTYNQAVLKREADILKHISAADDKLYRALQYAMTGNYIDFGSLENVSEGKLHELIESAPNIDLGETYNKFKRDLENAKSLVYLHDNCGEIVFDKMCIMELKALYPKLKITSIVRGEPILNDVTMADAEEVGLAGIVPVVGNGIAVPGTVLSEISGEARMLIDAADIIVSKGMGNYETMQGCGLNVYYLLLCKCERFMREFNQPYLSSVFIAERK